VTTRAASNADIRVQALLFAGVAAAAMYVAIVDVAAAFTPGYSHVAQPVSSLYQAGAPLGLPVAIAFACYNVLVVAFGVGVAMRAAALPDRRRTGIAAGIAIVLVGLAGALDDVFPQDPFGAVMTAAGTLHIVFAGIASLLTLAAIGLTAWWLAGRRSMRILALYSIASLVVIVVSAPFTAAATASSSPIMGLLERVTILTFTLWMAVTSVVLVREARGTGARSAAR